MGHTIGFVSVKGGVGKTTMALEVASALVKYYDKHVLVVDCNFSAPNVHLYLGIEPGLTLHDVLAEDTGYGMHKAIYEKYGFDVVPASLYYKDKVDILKLKRSLSRLRNRYDFIILDSSPNYDEMIPVVAAAEKIFIVTTPDLQTFTTSLKSAILAKKEETPIHGIIVNRIRNPKYELDLKDIEDLGGIPVVAKIKDSKKMGKALYYREPMCVHSDSDCITREVRKLASALVGEPSQPGGFFGKLFGWTGLIGKEEVNRDLMRSEFY